MMPRLLERYRSDIVPKLSEEFGFKNIHQVPKLVKIVVNMGVGEAAANPKLVETAAEELAVMRVVKVNRLVEYTEETKTVSGWSTIRVKHNSYSVPSRLIGEEVKVRVYESRLEVWYGGDRQLTMERLLGRMMPRGPEKLSLSRMNIGGLGTAMMRRVMRQKHVATLSDLMTTARQGGVRFVACAMSMDVMGIRRQELIEGVETGGVGTYLDSAESANVNLFV